MKILYFTDPGESKAINYSLGLSTHETHAWANKPGGHWPCSNIADHQLTIYVDLNGLSDAQLDNDNEAQIDSASSGIDGAELAAIITDHLPTHLRHLWPTWANIEQPVKAERKNHEHEKPRCLDLR